jgi:hypothetical protein
MYGIDCPYCLAPQSFLRSECCEVCHTRVPRKYIEIARTKPPVWIVTYGFAKHGKSALLGSISCLLEQVSTIVPNAYCTYLDDATIQQVAALQRAPSSDEASHGNSVPAGVLAPLLIALHNFPKEKVTQVLAIVDLPGATVEAMASRVADNVTKPPLHAKALAKAGSVWFVVSLYDLQKDHAATGRSINHLFWSYEKTLELMNTPLKKHAVVLAYTKAGLLHTPDAINQIELPETINTYLDSDPLRYLGDRGEPRTQPIDVDQYLSDMKGCADELQRLTHNCVPGGPELIAMVKDKGVELFCTINSALGGSPDPAGVIEVPTRCRRVLDALLWTVHFSERRPPQPHAAVILPGETPRHSIVSELAAAVHSALGKHQMEAATYFMGALEEAFPPGRYAPDAILFPGRAPLVGAILEKLPPDSIAVIVIDDVLPLDIDDFAVHAWDQRLLLLGINKSALSARIQWKFQVHSPSAVDTAVTVFSQQIAQARAAKP